MLLIPLETIAHERSSMLPIMMAWHARVQFCKMVVALGVRAAGAPPTEQLTASLL
jgi:hypothetical protein